jgi:DNA-binding transcriptional ArsR family regulator
MAPKQMSPEERAKVFKALADPRRVEIVEQLAKGAQCGTVLAETLGISVALLSHHWEVLVQAGVLRKERVGQLRVCSLDCDRLREALTMGGAWELSVALPAPKPSGTKKRSPSKRAVRQATRKPKHATQP